MVSLHLDFEKFDRLVGTDERLSGAFTYDFYASGLRRLIKELAINGLVGSVCKTPLEVINRKPTNLAVILGDSNRANVRYPFIDMLLRDVFGPEGVKRNDYKLEQSAYFDYLFQRYASLGLFKRVIGRRNCLIKVTRTVELSEYFVSNGNFRGFSSGGAKPSILDFPLALKLPDGLLELDGSHRRCVAYFHGGREIESTVVQIAELNRIFKSRSNRKSYFSMHWQKFLDVAGLSIER
jgi:hypothetical protein